MSSTLRDERAARLHAAMAQEGFDLLVLAGNAWRSDYLRHALDVTPAEGMAIALIASGAAAQLWVDRPFEAERIAAEQPELAVRWSPDPVGAVEAALTQACSGAEAGRVAPKIGLAPASIAPMRLALGFSGPTCTAATAMLDRLMLHKSPAEADAVERAVALADDGYQVFLAAARVGRREYELTADLEAWFRSRGCAENFMIMASGGTEVMTMRPPGERRLQHGDLVTTELTPCVDGYYAQICRTLVIGEPSPPQIEAYAVFLEALDAGIAAVRPGATYGAIARAQNDVFRSRGLADYITSKYTRVRGHGVGLYVDGVHVLEDVDTVLEPDMTLIVHPNTYHPKAGYLVLGDMVRVTDSGCRVLTRTSRSLQVATPGQLESAA